MPARQPLVLEIDCVVQCKSCNMHNNLRDVGRVEPGVCVYCDEIKELRDAMAEIGPLVVAASAADTARLRSAMAELAEAIGSSVRAMRAGIM